MLKKANHSYSGNLSQEGTSKNLGQLVNKGEGAGQMNQAVLT